MLYGLKSASKFSFYFHSLYKYFDFLLVTDPLFETVKSNLVQSIVSRLEDEVVKELVNALYHFAMTRLNPDDVTVSIDLFYIKLTMIIFLVHSTN
jgi:serine/threonine protein phosphatase PrpC